MGKILEQILMGNLKIELDDKDIIPIQQFGFRQGQSTVDAFSLLRDRTNSAFNVGNILTEYFLDIDSVWTD